MGKLRNTLKDNQECFLASSLIIGTGILDCYLTSHGLKNNIAPEGNFYYRELYNSLGNFGIYLGKIPLLTAIISISKKHNKTWPIDTGSITNIIGAGSWILSSYLV
ncbi:MAG: hypothetical protein ABH811_02955 [archaeon]